MTASSLSGIEVADGATVFEHACKLGLERIVWKRHYAAY
jgi:hypothetical protein